MQQIDTEFADEFLMDSPNEAPMLLYPAAEGNLFLLLCADRRGQLQLCQIVLYLQSLWSIFSTHQSFLCEKMGKRTWEEAQRDSQCVLSSQKEFLLSIST